MEDMDQPDRPWTSLTAQPQYIVADFCYEGGGEGVYS